MFDTYKDVTNVSVNRQGTHLLNNFNDLMVCERVEKMRHYTKELKSVKFCKRAGFEITSQNSKGMLAFQPYFTALVPQYYCHSSAYLKVQGMALVSKYGQFVAVMIMRRPQIRHNFAPNISAHKFLSIRERT